jgi:L-threonylcarbamoyladenylate synthase
LKTSCDVLKVSATDPEPDIITAAVHVIGNGGVIAFPTSGLYGLGADALNPEAVSRIFRIKRRPLHKPILLLVKDVRDLSRIVREVPPAAEKLMNAFWPGGLTLVFNARDTLPGVLTGRSGKIGVRIPIHPVARALVGRLKSPLTGTSANLSEGPGCNDISMLDADVAAHLELILDAGPLKGGPGSTVVDVTVSKPLILREGSVAGRQIKALLA